MNPVCIFSKDGAQYNVDSIMFCREDEQQLKCQDIAAAKALMLVADTSTGDLKYKKTTVYKKEQQE